MVPHRLRILVVIANEQSKYANNHLSAYLILLSSVMIHLPSRNSSSVTSAHSKIMYFNRKLVLSFVVFVFVGRSLKCSLCIHKNGHTLKAQWFWFCVKEVKSYGGARLKVGKCAVLFHPTEYLFI